MPPNLAPLQDILDQILLITEFTDEIDWESFQQDKMRQHAVMRCLEIIGEATRRLSPEFRANHPNVPWQDIAGMRSMLIHAYDKVDLEQVWETVKKDIPDLDAKLRLLLPPNELDQAQDA